jgi:hypothetical protein
MNKLVQSVSLLFAEVIFVWHATNYLWTADPTRSDRMTRSSRNNIGRLTWFVGRALIAALLATALAGWWHGTLLAIAMLAWCVLLPIARWLWIPARYIAFWEIFCNAGFALTSQYLINSFHMSVQPAWLRFPAQEHSARAYAIAAALMIFVVRGGTLIVRGVLDMAGTMPPPELPQKPGLPQNTLDLERALPVDTIELNHGRLIGNIERLILVLFVANSQYTALAFFFAAKGLIRSKDVERRAWADYLILGSLTSFLVAVAAGLLIQAAFEAARG